MRFLVVLILCSASFSFAQQVSTVNFDHVKAVITDTSSTLYYPKLKERLLKLDTTLTNKEFKYLYYGNVFQDYYHPYGATNKEVEFLKAVKRNSKADEVENLAFEVLNENPVDLQVLLQLIYCYNGAKMVNKATQVAKMYVGFLEVIYASGTGQNCENGFVVISVDDEYQIAGDLGLTVVSQRLEGECDHLIFSKKGQKRKTRIKTLYFNVRLPLTYLSKSFNKSKLPDAETAPDVAE